MSKKLKQKKVTPVEAAQPDAVVEAKQSTAFTLPAPPIIEPMKRLTLSIPLSLHRKIRLACFERDTTITDEVLQLLIKHFDNV
jgi:hypothetical protein